MFNKDVNRNIKKIDEAIGKLQDELLVEEDEVKYEQLMLKIESLTDLRVKLNESKEQSSVKSALISGAFGIASIALVLKYEETEVITSKAFGMATSIFRGSK